MGRKPKICAQELRIWFSIAKNKALFQHPLKRSQKDTNWNMSSNWKTWVQSANSSSIFSPSSSIYAQRRMVLLNKNGSSIIQHWLFPDETQTYVYFVQPNKHQFCLMQFLQFFVWFLFPQTKWKQNFIFPYWNQTVISEIFLKYQGDFKNWQFLVFFCFSTNQIRSNFCKKTQFYMFFM